MTCRRFLYCAAVGGGWALGSWVWIAVFVPVAWLISAYRWPFAPCWRCQGRKTNKGSSRKRFGSCGLCGGSGTRQVLGSKTVNRAIRSVVRFRKERGK